LLRSYGQEARRCAQRRWIEDAKSERQHRERGARIYFIRLQISHIYEALKIVEEIRDSPTLMRAVDRSDRFTKKNFVALLTFIASPEFEKMMGRIRSNLTFHYDPKTIDRTLASRLPSNLIADFHKNGWQP
jgi:hypothetical protein